VTLIELYNYTKHLIDDGTLNPNLVVKFRESNGKLSDIDYSVMNNQRDNIVFAEDWF
jgi:hypothetical protein